MIVVRHLDQPEVERIKREHALAADEQFVPGWYWGESGDPFPGVGSFEARGVRARRRGGLRPARVERDQDLNQLPVPAAPRHRNLSIVATDVAMRAFRPRAD